jgi:hypothetical protein
VAASTVKVGNRIYVADSPFTAKDKLKGIGCHWDGERRQWWIGATKEAELTAVVSEINGSTGPTSNGERQAQDPKDIRLTGKGVYKGRNYFLGSYTRDGAKVRCLTLPDASGKFLDFWADRTQVHVIKTYQTREVRTGFYGRGGTRTEYTTLGSIAAFVRDQKDPATGDVCADCGKRAHLIHDLEDGMMKCRNCCDIPSE